MLRARAGLGRAQVHEGQGEERGAGEGDGERANLSSLRSSARERPTGCEPHAISSFASTASEIVEAEAEDEAEDEVASPAVADRSTAVGRATV